MSLAQRARRTRPLYVASLPLGFGFGLTTTLTDGVMQAAVMLIAWVVALALELVQWWASDERTRQLKVQMTAAAFMLCVVAHATLVLFERLGGPVADDVVRVFLLPVGAIMVVDLCVRLREWRSSRVARRLGA